jgi:hypothetical protein
MMSIPHRVRNTNGSVRGNRWKRSWRNNLKYLPIEMQENTALVKRKESRKKSTLLASIKIAKE